MLAGVISWYEFGTSRGLDSIFMSWAQTRLVTAVVDYMNVRMTFIWYLVYSGRMLV